MYEAIIYFLGPLSKWGGKPDEREIIWRRRHRFKFWAMVDARSRCRVLDKCLWAVRRGGEVVAGELPVRSRL